MVSTKIKERENTMLLQMNLRLKKDDKIKLRLLKEKVMRDTEIAVLTNSDFIVYLLDSYITTHIELDGRRKD